jgi:cytochrome c oxidase subunit 2
LKAIVIGIVGAVLGCVLGFLVDRAHALPGADSSVQATNTDWLYSGLLVVTGGIFGLVTAVLVAAVVLFRKRRGDPRVSSPVHGHTGLELVWTIIPTIIVVVFTILSWQVLNDNEAAKADPNRMRIVVTGYQWNWKYTYLDGSGNPTLRDSQLLEVPLGARIEFRVESTDVIHGWWVPDWRVQINATPGQTNLVYVTPTRLGTVPVVCTFICGQGHPQMGSEVEGAFPSRIRIVPQAAYDQFMAKALADQAKADANPAAKAVAVFKAQNCGGCHTWTPAGASGAVGPSLDNVAADAKTAGQDLAAYIKESIVAPGAYIVPNYQALMPPGYGDKISAADLDALVKALATGGK